MKRQKTALLLIISLIAVPLLFAESQRIYDSDNIVMDLMRNLYIDQGLSLPSTTGPWSKDELLLMLSRIDDSHLSDESERLYDSIAFYLGGSFDAHSPEENLELDLELITNIESYTHTNPLDFSHIDKWGMPGYKIPAPMLKAEVSIGLYDKFFMFLDPAIGLVRNYQNPDKMKEAYSYTNLILVPPAVTLDTSANTPQRAYTSVGSHGWNLMLGREKVSWGPGHTGNFIFGDQIPYHDMLKVSAYTNKFKYTFITSFLIHPQNYFTKYGTAPDWDHAENKEVLRDNYGYMPLFGQSSWMNGIYMYMHHRFEWRIAEKFGLTVTEGILYQHPENYLDLRVLNPMMIFHNLYMKQHANSLLGIDFDWTPARGFNLYLSLVCDDLAVPFVENSNEVKGSASPNSIGAMLGMNMSLPQKEGFWEANIELAYTDPYLYLRDIGVVNAELGEKDYGYGLSFFTGIREYGSENSSRYDLVWLGYRHGGDAVVANIDFQYSDYDGWGAGGGVFYMAHGVKNILTRWRGMRDGFEPELAPSTGKTDYYPVISKNGDELIVDEATGDRKPNAVSHTLIFSAKGYYSLKYNMVFNGKLDLVTVWNPGNIFSLTPAFDSQLTLGFTISY